jgi:mono/diheme cytochrome c family protein
MFRKLLGITFFLALVGAAGIVALLALKPVNKRAAPPLSVERTPERIARGKYLFNHVSGCAHCHSETEEGRFGHPVKPGGYAIGKVQPAGMGLPGVIVAVNLTGEAETGIGGYSDGQLLRAIREGIGADERVLFPFMPYAEFRNMSDEDAYSLIAYIRTLAPVKHELPKTRVKFPASLLMKSAPRVVERVESPNPANRVAYGRYLANIAGCKFCHSPVGKDGSLIAGREFAGGHEFQLEPGARVVSANLTPDAKTGTGSWSEQDFVDKFLQYREYAEKGAPQVEASRNTLMPWLYLANMNTDDLRAIFAYLKTVPAVSNAVVTHPDAPEEVQLRQR